MRVRQVWLAMYHLMCEDECRKRYHFNSMRKNSILRVRKYINDLLLDQLPVLAGVQRQAIGSVRIDGDLEGLLYSQRAVLVPECLGSCERVCYLRSVPPYLPPCSRLLEASHERC